MNEKNVVAIFYEQNEDGILIPLSPEQTFQVLESLKTQGRLFSQDEMGKVEAGYPALLDIPIPEAKKEESRTIVRLNNIPLELTDEELVILAILYSIRGESDVTHTFDSIFEQGTMRKYRTNIELLPINSKFRLFHGLREKVNATSIEPVITVTPMDNFENIAFRGTSSDIRGQFTYEEVIEGGNRIMRAVAALERDAGIFTIEDFLNADENDLLQRYNTIGMGTIKIGKEAVERFQHKNT